jgi:hypothetical protein
VYRPSISRASWSPDKSPSAAASLRRRSIQAHSTASEPQPSDTERSSRSRNVAATTAPIGPRAPNLRRGLVRAQVPKRRRGDGSGRGTQGMHCIAGLRHRQRRRVSARRDAGRVSIADTADACRALACSSHVHGAQARAVLALGAPEPSHVTRK